MATESLEAWVLHKQPSGDTSVFITFFTREKGIIKCLCKGGRTPKKQAILQAFTPLWISVDSKKDRNYVRQFETASCTFNLKGDTLFASLYLNELLYYSLSPADPHPALFDVYLETLRGLVTVTDNLVMEALLRRFEWSLLIACGQAISLTEEAHSGRLIDAARYYHFQVNEGFIPAEAGLSGKDILALSQGCFNSVSVLKTAKYIMRQAIEALLDGRVLKSRTLYALKNSG
ncbi:DNA repair protein RecO [Legionella jamestowniensis]|uniref:DNA repair protein RecO n=1 Tax=Legionella jamestowniensis TaxID=455 RepID=A0A0W0UGV6_9GAMM|nr:DNA repair protein RecO [Legionella jamestowniensis]KTD07131.1 DNA repair protein RecO [Legionella jamestowniensis]OCH98918.1 DNA repair protein RecO [Legionella jamestowniensis]SFL71389.1 DNA replication and repair protein RecO [Legionella jamestowniensis DSM 19215]